MDRLQKGQLVRSKAGRDKDNIYVILDIKDEYLFLADGNLRKVENPKKKKHKHVQPINLQINSIKAKILNEEKINNAEIRKELIDYQNNPNLS